MTTLSTHVLDTTLGRPAGGVRIALEVEGEPLAAAVTDTDGRAADLGGALDAGTYVLRFDTGGYFTGRGIDCFYPEVLVTFTSRERATSTCRCS